MSASFKLSQSPSTDIHLSDISCAPNDDNKLLASSTPIHVLLSHTPSFIPRVNSTGSNLAALTDGFNLGSPKPTTHSFSQLLSNSHLHDQIASEVDYSAYIGKQKHLFAHTPGTTYYHSQSLFSVSHKHLLCILTLLFTLHWFNDGIFQYILTSASRSAYDATHSTLILSASLISIVVFAPIIGYLARSHPPLRLLWIGFCLILLSTFIISFATSFVAMFCARLLMGVGDAAVIPIAAPLVLYTAPPSHKSLMLSIFLCSIPLGYSFGYFVASELLDSLPSFSIFDQSWQRLFCWETILLIPIILYSWWRVKGPDSFIAMANYNIKTHNVCDILTNQIYLGIVIGHTLQGFGCCVLTIIVWNKLNDAAVAGNGKGINLDPIEIWSLCIFILGSMGILIGGLSTDYWHNKSVFHAKKRKKRTKHIQIQSQLDEEDEYHRKASIAASSNPHEEDGDIAQCHSLVDVCDTGLSSNIRIKEPANANATTIGTSFQSKSMDHHTPHTLSSFTSPFPPRSLNSDGIMDRNRNETMQQYKWRKFVENQQHRTWTSGGHGAGSNSSLQAQYHSKASLIALKQEQMDAAKTRKEKLKRKRERERRRNKKKFKPITNLHTIRICLYGVIIPSSVTCFLCIVLLYFFADNWIAFGVLALIAQILTFVQVSALYTSMLWVIGIEWQCFGCAVAEIGFRLAGDGISPGLIANLLQDRFEFNLLLLITVMLVSILIFFVSWKFVDFQIWNITKNNKNSKMFDLLYDDETTTYTSTSTMINAARDHDQEQSTSTSSSSANATTVTTTTGATYNDTFDADNNYEESQTNENSDLSASDWNPGNY
eukprot:719276_1